MKKLIILAIITALGMAKAYAEDGLEAPLIDALRLDQKTQERRAESGPAIQNYVQQGYLKFKPNGRADYTDFYVLQKPAGFMGHTLVMIEEEYMSQFIGCCVSPGMGITVKINGSTRAMAEFAAQNGCNFEPEAVPNEVLEQAGIKAHLPPGNYASLSCRERDIKR